MKLRILSGIVALAVAAFAGPMSAATNPGGIYAILAANTPAQFPVAEAALQEPGVAGLLIHLRWAQISDGVMHYDWTTLDSAITLANKYHKRYEIGIVTGGATPAWVTRPVSKGGLGGTPATFTVDASVGGGCTTYTTAAPYDPAYMTAFRDLMIKLAAHLRAMQFYAELSLLKLDGITTTTDELRQPAINLPASDNCPNSDTTKTWITLGYTPGKMRSAWDSMLHTYRTQFPDKSFSIGFIGINAFPGIDATGQRAPTEDKRQSLSAQLTRNMIGDAGRLMPGHVALGFDSLTLNVPSSDTTYGASLTTFFNDASAAGVRLGWQVNELCGEYPTTGTGLCTASVCTVNTCSGAACGGSSKADAVICANAAQFKAMLLAGVQPNNPAAPLPESQGVYLELFPQNISAWPSAVKAANQQLAPW